MKAYPEYKNSGIQWLGEIPEHWKVNLVKRIVDDHKQGFYTQDEYVDRGVKLLRITDIDDNSNVSYLNCPFVQITENDRLYFSLNVNDFVFARSGTIGRFGIIREVENVVFASYLIRFRFHKNYFTNFLKYYYLSYFFKHSLNSDLHGGANKNIHAENIKYQFLPLPPLTEQKAISDYLDEKCEKVDRLMEKKKQEILLLKEYRKAMINQAVTKGLDPKVNMKDSGIQWLGEIPEHWQVKSLKHINDVIMGQSPNSDDYNDNQLGLPFLQGNADFTSYYPQPRIWCDTANKTAKVNDILLSVRAPVGSVNIADQNYGIGRGLCAIRSKNTIFKLLYYMTLTINEELNSIATGSTYTAISVDDIRNMSFPFCPLDEQKAIADYLDEKCEKVDRLMEKIEKHISLLKEYKSALISEAVTGKIDVR